jgi:hypothetical protein
MMGRLPRAPHLAYRLPDTYGLVLALIILDYLLVSTLITYGWGSVVAIFCLGATLLVTLRISTSRRLWQQLAVIYLIVSTGSSLVSALAPGAGTVSQYVTILAGVLLAITPVVIVRHVASQQIINTETVLGAVCVYLLIGFSFAFIYSGIALLSPNPFFLSQSPATIDNTLFFSYTTLTTVGYGNLVPAASFGQTFAMLEALLGQIYLVLIVARLVSLWGQQRPRTTSADHLQRPRTGPRDAGDASGDSEAV